MHELHVCQALIGQVETISSKNKAGHVQIIYPGIWWSGGMREPVPKAE